ncbi:TPA: hypothetical protein DCQ44_02010 [Candidatus Taylorbacteria bacterium]|nr:hypothetical protein [Candidatus Taylorbacteria bacterium]
MFLPGDRVRTLCVRINSKSPYCIIESISGVKYRHGTVPEIYAVVKFKRGDNEEVPVRYLRHRWRERFIIRDKYLLVISLVITVLLITSILVTQSFGIFNWILVWTILLTMIEDKFLRLAECVYQQRCGNLTA